MAESRERDGWGGKYTEYFNDAGDKIGESREVDSVFGKRTEYRDTNYKKTGESRRWLGLRGPYTTHEGTGWFPGAQRKTKDGVFSVGGGGVCDNGSSFRWAGSAVAIVAVLFVVGLLLAWGLGSITRTNIGASNPAPRGTLAPAPRVTFAPTPPATVRAPRPLTPRVKDDARLLTPAERERLERLLADGEQRTKAQMIVALLESLQGEDLEEYSRRLANAWNVGRKDINDGVVLFVFKNDHKLRLAVGLGLEQTIPNAVAEDIITGVVAPRFRAGEYSAGLEEAATAIYRRIEKSQRPER